MADVDEAAKKEVKDILLSYDRTLLVADPRRCEPKKCASASCPKDVSSAACVGQHTRLWQHMQCCNS